jgi:nucleosome assembly protein 1-like 1
MGEYHKERVVLETKYQGLLKPLYEQRAAVISGTAAAGEGGGVLAAAADAAGAAAGGEGGAGKGIPNFWLTAIQNHELICETISERDEGALAYLTDIRTAFHEDMDGYKLEFEFSVNPYFTNLVLSKSYDVPNFIELDNNPQLAGTEGTEIDWKPGMDLTVEMVTKKVKKKGQRKGRPQTKTVTREEECKSFFNFFSPPDLEEEDDEDEGDEDAYEERAALIDLDFELGMIFSKQVVKGTRHAGGTRGAGGG